MNSNSSSHDKNDDSKDLETTENTGISAGSAIEKELSSIKKITDIVGDEANSAAENGENSSKITHPKSRKKGLISRFLPKKRLPKNPSIAFQKKFVADRLQNQIAKLLSETRFETSAEKLEEKIAKIRQKKGLLFLVNRDETEKIEHLYRQFTLRK